MTGCVLARPEPLPMFLFNRAIKSSAAGKSFDQLAYFRQAYQYIYLCLPF